MEFFLIVANSSIALCVISGFVCVISGTFAVVSKVDGKGEVYPMAKRISICASVLFVLTAGILSVREGVIQTRKDMIVLRYTEGEKVDELEANAIDAIQKAPDIAEEAVK